MIHFSHPQIVLQEVPDEISLALSISGCRLRCNYCHSPFTWDEKFGEQLTDSRLRILIKQNKYITCVLFYGGEHNSKRLIELVNIIKQYNLKVALYSGLRLKQINQKLKSKLNYLKVGPYIAERGALSSKTTNQRMYNLDAKIDITYKFWH